MPTTFRGPKRSVAPVAHVFGAIAILAVALTIFSCSDKEKGFIPPTDPGGGGASDTTGFTGFLLNGANGARLDVTIETTALAPAYPSRTSRRHGAPGAGGPTVPATGVLWWPGGNVSLTGAYDFGADTLYLAGGGRTLHGDYGTIGSSSMIRGTATTPDGPGAFLLGQNSQLPWVAWAGTFTANGSVDHGTMGFVRADTTLAGMSFQTGANAAMLFQGNVSSTGVPKTVFFDGSLPSTYTVTGTGTLNETTGSAGGNYTFSIVNANYGTTQSGTFSMLRR